MQRMALARSCWCERGVRSCMNWYATREDDYSSPIIRGMHRYKGGDHKRDRFLSDDEIRALWKACDDSGTYGAMLKVLLLTGQRRKKVATMKWDDVVAGEWRIPYKKGQKPIAKTLNCRKRC